MLNTIEGVGNLFNMRNLIDESCVSGKYNPHKLEEKMVRDSVCNIEINENEMYDALMAVFEKPTEIIPTSTPKYNYEPIVINEPKLPKPPKPQVSPSTITPFFKKPTVMDTPFMTDNEKKKFNNFMSDNNEEKMDLLDSVKSIREELKSIPGTLTGIPDVDETSHINDIRSVHKLLLHKKNRHINYETVRDIVMMGINKLTSYCDGRGNRPNLHGWDRTAKYKLSCLKHELSNIASDFFKKYNISPLFQILISLVPSALVYMSTSQQQHQPMDNSSMIDDINNL
jgi:hypothetical protein